MTALQRVYATWAQNCRNSVVWLLDDEAQKKFYDFRQTIGPSREVREVKAKQFAAKALRYDALVESSK